MRWIYSAVLVVVMLVSLPAFLIRKVWKARAPVRLGERLGRVDVPPGRDRFWVHAVSVGEVVAAVPLVQALRARWPETPVIVSTVTGTGEQMARLRLPEALAVITFPLDLGWVMRRAIRRVAPRCFVALETELWPNLLLELRRAGVPAVLANGRISDRSYRRYRWVRGLFSHVLRQVALFAMQSDEDARRIINLGAPPERVVVTGSLKMEVGAAAAGAEALWRRLLHLGSSPVVVAGSTHRGEEGAVLEALAAARRVAPDVRLVLAPRHPERLDEVEGLVQARGFTVVRRTRIAAGARTDVILIDTIGELAAVYGVADVVFIGGSLAPIGGHNVVEPALHARPVLIGPEVSNFRASVALLVSAGGAVQVRDAAELGTELAALLADAPRRLAMGRAAWTAVQAEQGACRRTVAALETCLPGSRP